VRAECACDNCGGSAARNRYNAESAQTGDHQPLSEWVKIGDLISE